MVWLTAYMISSNSFFIIFLMFLNYNSTYINIRACCWIMTEVLLFNLVSESNMVTLIGVLPCHMSSACRVRSKDYIQLYLMQFLNNHILVDWTEMRYNIYFKIWRKAFLIWVLRHSWNSISVLLTRLPVNIMSKCILIISWQP